MTEFSFKGDRDISEVESQELTNSLCLFLATIASFSRSGRRRSWARREIKRIEKRGERHDH